MNPGVVDNDDEEKGRPPQLPPTASQQPDVMTSTTSFLPQQQDAHHHHAALPNSDSSGSIEPSKTPVHSSGSSASFLPPIFGGGGSERDSSRSGSDSAESRTDFTVAPPSGAASTSGWHLSSRGGSVARHSGSTSHSDSPNSNKSPTKLPRLEGGGGGSGLGSVGGGVFSPESVGSAAGLTTPLLTPRLTFMGATTSLEGAPREAVPEEFFSSPEPELSTELLKADPLTQLFLQSNVNQQQQPPQFAASNVLRLPSIDSSATSSSGLSPRSIFLQESAGASTLHQELQQGGSASPPHLHQSKHGGVKRKHRRRRKGSELPSETQQQQQHLPPSDQLVEACQSEDHIRQGLCERNAACYVDAAEAFARSSGFTLPGEPLEENDLDSETTTTTRVEFDLPDEVDIEEPPQQQRLYHSYHVRPPDNDSITDERLESVNYADDEMFSNESPRDSDVETPLAAHDTPTPHNCCEAVHHPEPCDDALEMKCGAVSGDAQSLDEVVEDASQGAPS